MPRDDQPVVAKDMNLPLIRIAQTQNGFDHRGLTNTVQAHKTEHFARPYIHAEVVKNEALAVGDTDMVDRKCRISHGSRRARRRGLQLRCRICRNTRQENAAVQIESLMRTNTDRVN